jgi:thiamine phosphate synthase YjbQ (UPF0047 family)
MNNKSYINPYYMQRTIILSTGRKNGLHDITPEVNEIVQNSHIRQGIVSVYDHGSAANKKGNYCNSICR